MAFEILIAVLVFAGAVYFLASPLLQASTSVSGSPEEEKQRHLQNLNIRKEEVLSTLKDLQLDRDTNKISEPDFQVLYAESFEAGKNLLKEIDEVAQGKKSFSAAPVSHKPITAKYCHQCGASLVPQARFCSQCGTPVPGGIS